MDYLVVFNCLTSCVIVIYIFKKNVNAVIIIRYVKCRSVIRRKLRINAETEDKPWSTGRSIGII